MARIGRRSALLLTGGTALAAAGYVAFGSRFGGGQRLGAIKNYVMVQSRDTPRITFVDAASDRIAGAITLPTSPDQMVVSEPVKRVIFASIADKSVSILDPATQTVETRIGLPFVPGNIVLSPDGLTLAVAGPDDGAVGLVDLPDRSLRATLDGLDRPAKMAFSNDSGYLLLSDNASSMIRVINALSGRELDPIRLSIGDNGAGPPDLSAVTRTPNGLYGLSVDNASGKLSLINFGNWAEAATLNVGRNPSRPYGTADGQYMMIANSDDRTVSILSTAYFQTEATLPGVSDVTSIATGFFETLAFVISSSEEKAVVIDLTEMAVIGEIALPGRPGPAVVDADGRKMYVALSDSDELAVVDVFEKKILTVLSDVGENPWQVSMAATNNYCH